MSSKILLALVLAAGCTAGVVLGINQKLILPRAQDTRVAQVHRPKVHVPVPARERAGTPRGQRVPIYVAQEQGDDFALVRAKQPVYAASPEQALRHLIQFPKERGDQFGTIPPGTRLRKLTISEDGTASVDFSREFVENFPGGSQWEALVIYSVVDTLTEFDRVKRVRFLVEGEPISDLGGHVDLSEPLERDVTSVGRSDR